MRPFTRLEAIAAPLYEANIDTDKLIPHRFLRKPLSAGYRNFLFYNQRFTPEGEPKPGFVLDREPFNRAQILVAGANFGCGSTREGAVYALADFGIRAVIAPSFGDIFHANLLQNGMLPVVLPEAVVAGLAGVLQDSPGVTIQVDLERQVVRLPGDEAYRFEIEASRKARLLAGEDDIAITLRHAAAIEAFERNYHGRLPWLRRRAS